MAPRDVRAGGAFVELALRANKFERQLRGVSNKLKRFGSQVASFGAKFAAVGAGVGTAFLPAIKAASDMEETMAKFDTVFGSSSGAVKAFSDDLAGKLGRSKQQIASFLASSQDLFVPLGFDDATATQLSKRLTTLAVDLASFNNLQDTDALRDLQAALTGSGEVMKKYGVLVSEAAVKQRLLNDGIDPKTATQQQKVMARLNIILDGTTAAQGDAERTSGSFANQLRRLNGTFRDMQVALGSAVLPIVTKFVSRANQIVMVAAGWIEQNQKLVAAVAGVAATVAVAGATIAGLGITINAAGTVVAGLATAFGLLTSPVGLVVTSVAAATAALASFTAEGRAVSSFLGETFAKTFAAVTRAFESGDLQKAGRIAMLGLNRIWATGLISLQAFTLKTVDRIQTAFENMVLDVIQKLSGFFAKLGRFIGSSKLEALAANAPTIAGLNVQNRQSQRSLALTFAMDKLRKQLEEVETAFQQGTSTEQSLFETGKSGLAAVGGVFGQAVSGALGAIGGGITRAATEGLKTAARSDAGITNATFSARAAAQLGGFQVKTVEKNTAKTAEVLEDIKGLIERGRAMLPVL